MEGDVPIVLSYFGSGVCRLAFNLPFSFIFLSFAFKWVGFGTIRRFIHPFSLHVLPITKLTDGRMHPYDNADS